MKEFKKLDTGKSRPDLIPTGVLKAMGDVMAYGAAKYEIDNWQKCEDPRRYEAAAMRHIVAHLDGEKLDPESGLPHLAHALCSIAMRMGLDSVK